MICPPLEGLIAWMRRVQQGMATKRRNAQNRELESLWSRVEELEQRDRRALIGSDPKLEIEVKVVQIPEENILQAILEGHRGRNMCTNKSKDIKKKGIAKKGFPSPFRGKGGASTSRSEAPTEEKIKAPRREIILRGRGIGQFHGGRGFGGPRRSLICFKCRGEGHRGKWAWERKASY
eukprot:Gb_09161 [translate_table: standard]